jgi:hypothetical protein
MDRLRSLAAIALAIALGAVAGHAGMAWAQAVETSASNPQGVAVHEVIPCNSGVSPCPVTAANTVVLNANPKRSSALICASGTATIYCCLNATTCAGASAYDFALKAASAANDGSGSCITLGSFAGRTWTNGVTCAGSGSGAVSVEAY